MKSAVKQGEADEDGCPLEHFGPGDVENVSGQQMLELFLPTSDPAQHQDDSGGRYHEGDSDDRFLGNVVSPAPPGPAEECRAEEGHSQGNPERDPIVEMVAGEQRDAGAQGGHLGERQVDKDHLPLHDMKSQVHQKWRQNQARGQRPLHDFPDYLEIHGIHLAFSSAVASVPTR